MTYEIRKNGKLITTAKSKRLAITAAKDMAKWSKIPATWRVAIGLIVIAEFKSAA
jgi:hypothetical protein